MREIEGKNKNQIINLIKLLCFLTYTTTIFFIANYYIILIMFLINIVYIIFFKINFKKIINNIWRFFDIHIAYSYI